MSASRIILIRDTTYVCVVPKKEGTQCNEGTSDGAHGVDYNESNRILGHASVEPEGQDFPGASKNTQSISKYSFLDYDHATEPWPIGVLERW